jgi:hypothetical protein
MGASASAHSEELLAARARLTDAQLQALDACFAFGELDSEAFQARVGPGGRLGERLAALLAAQAHLPPALRRAAHGVTLEALTIAKATLESGTDEQVAAFGTLLLPAPCRLADVASLVSDFVSAVYPVAGEEASAAAAHAIASGVAEPARDGSAAANDAHAPQTSLHTDDVVAWLQRTPAALRTLRGALAVPQGLPWRPASLDYRSTPQHVSLLTASWAWLIAPLLPPACQQGWTLLFSSLAHGASFSTLFGRSAGRGPMLVLVRDKSSALAAGFADAPLIKRAAFYGGYSCLLMGLLPQARVYQPSGNNEHMVWCADGFESVPNGIGFGGQVRGCVHAASCQACACADGWRVRYSGESFWAVCQC